MGSDYRGTLMQLDDGLFHQVRENNLARLHETGVSAIETNVLYAVAFKG